MNVNWEIEFYELSDGNKPVFNFIDSLPTKEKAKVIGEIELLENYGTELGPPRLRKIKGKRYNGLWELRIRFSSNYYRIFYFLFQGRLFVLLHGFIKKKNKTDIKELEIAKNRMNEYINSRR
ncbi:MAG: type II toxin-antitoxin system RelE/ParE family toxin [Actinobacteria bacterium]|nr:type II toxin-antitoxin system RelE/ParE family toxin [Actinomycetota bacterium]